MNENVLALIECFAPPALFLQFDYLDKNIEAFIIPRVIRVYLPANQAAENKLQNRVT